MKTVSDFAATPIGAAIMAWLGALAVDFVQQLVINAKAKRRTENRDEQVGAIDAGLNALGNEVSKLQGKLETPAPPAGP